MDFEIILDELEEFHIEKVKAVEEKKVGMDKLREKESAMQALDLNTQTLNSTRHGESHVE